MKLIVFATLVTLASCQQRFGSRHRRPLLTRSQITLPGVNVGVGLTGNSLPVAPGRLSLSGGTIPQTNTALPVAPNFGGAISPNLARFTPRVVIAQGVHADFNGRTQAEEENLIEQEWGTFQSQFNKVYSSAEEAAKRKEIFIENRKKVTQHNQDYAFGRTTFFLRLNPLADLLTHEFNTLLNGFGKSRRGQGVEGRDDIGAPQASTYVPLAHTSGLPKTVDWRQEGAVTSVKTQLQCAGCFAFSAAGAIEGHNFRKTGNLVDLSPQHLIDCTNNDDYSNLGCGGGYVDDCFEYVKNNPGIDTEASYPFEAQTGQCRFNEAAVGANVTGFVSIPQDDEEALAEAVATQGPVSVAIDAGHDTFQLYSEGIYFDPQCKNNADGVNHAVLVVGYGEEPDGRKYWLVKNAYGPEWGIGGYIKMAKDVGNHCGIASVAYYPLV